MKLEEQLRNDAQSLAELGWFNRADMMKAAANEIQRLEQRIKRLEKAGNQLKDRYILENENWDLKTVNDWNEAKEEKP